MVYDPENLTKYMNAAVGVTPDRPILIDRFFNHALECEADAISDGTHAFVPAVMEHIELAGVHSGDSACIIPSRHISEDNVKTIKEYTRKIAKDFVSTGFKILATKGTQKALANHYMVMERNTTISYWQLNQAMHLGKLGQQFVLKSRKAFEGIRYVGYEDAKSDEWYCKKMFRDRMARREYFDVERNKRERGDIYIMQIIDEELKVDDLRI